MAVPGKQYGLILPQKKGLIKGTGLKKYCVFGDDSDDETSVGESLQKEAAKKKTMRQTQLEMKKALEQDSSVYDYDAVYDDIQQQKLDNSKKVLSEAEKRVMYLLKEVCQMARHCFYLLCFVVRQPKYIHQLMKAVENRKKEQERREERKIQKEREAEGEQFADKEAYVTTAYKLKLQEQKEELEREKRQAAIEAALDVRKQKDLSGFYRHLLNQTVGEEAIPDRSANKSESSEDPKVPEASQTHCSNTLSPGSDIEDACEEKHAFNKPATTTTSHSKRHYRQRSPSSGSCDEERERDRRKKRERDTDKQRSRRDEDRNSRSHGSVRDVERQGRRKERSSKDVEREKERSSKDGEREKERQRSRNSEEDERKDKAGGEERIKNEEDADKIKVKTEGEKVNKFAKRSTEQTMSSARDRYLARQMARSASKSYIEREED